MTQKDVYLAGGARTAFGKYGGGFTGASVTDLATPVVHETLRRAALASEAIDHVVFGNVLPSTKTAVWAARVTALAAGIPESSSALVVNRACGTGLQAVVSAAEQVLLGHSQAAIAAGGETFSSAPHMFWSRWGTKRGTPPIDDMLDWAYSDPFGNQMGQTAENLCAAGQISRQAQDEYGARSQARTEHARQAGYLAREIVTVNGVDADEFPRPHVDYAKLAAMAPAYRSDGVVTAGTSSGVNDGAAAIAVLDATTVAEHSIEPDGRIVDWATVGVAPRLMGSGPVPATERLLARTGLGVADIDVFEINEAFAAVTLYAINQLKLDPELTNPNGGAISIGHPPGATGIRMLVSALNHLRRTGGRYGLVSMCLGGGMGMALIVENLKR